MAAAPIVWILNLGSTLAMCGLIWLVQVVQYPGFNQVGAEAFVAYHQHHTASITYVVLPLMAAELLTSFALLWSPPPGIATPWMAAGLGLVLLAWASTAFVQVPQHELLAGGYDPEVQRQLVVGNWIRTAAWTARGVMMLWLTFSMLRPALEP